MEPQGTRLPRPERTRRRGMGLIGNMDCKSAGRDKEDRLITSMRTAGEAMRGSRQPRRTQGRWLPSCWGAEIGGRWSTMAVPGDEKLVNGKLFI